MENNYFSSVFNLKINHTSSFILLTSSNPNDVAKEFIKYYYHSKIKDFKSTHSNLACVFCSMINRDIYPDLIKLDGSITSIKKAEVLNMISKFSLTSLNGENIKFGVLIGLENSSTEAANSLLKFLEEPPDNTILIIVTKNENSLLSTISSRCQTINCNQIVQKINKSDKTLNDNNVDDLKLYYSHFFEIANQTNELKLQYEFSTLLKLAKNQKIIDLLDYIMEKISNNPNASKNQVKLYKVCAELATQLSIKALNLNLWTSTFLIKIAETWS